MRSGGAALFTVRVPVAHQPVSWYLLNHKGKDSAGRGSVPFGGKSFAVYLEQESRRGSRTNGNELSIPSTHCLPTGRLSGMANAPGKVGIASVAVVNDEVLSDDL